jgi:hypothetical protein
VREDLTASRAFLLEFIFVPFRVFRGHSSASPAAANLQFPVRRSDNRRELLAPLSSRRCTMRVALLLLSVFLIPSAALAQAPAAPPLVNTAQAAKLLDKRVTVQLEVKSTGGNTACFLNSAADFRDAGNFTIFLPGEVLEKFKQAKIEKPGDYYKGKTVQVTGTVALYKEKPQIRVDDPAQIKVVERK